MTVIQLVRKLSTFNKIKISTLPHTKECHNTTTSATPTSQHSQSISITSLIRTLLHLVLGSGLITCGFLSNNEGTSHLPIPHASSILSYSIGLHQHQLVVYKSQSSLLHNIVHHPVSLILLGPNILITLSTNPNFIQQSVCLPTFKTNTLPPLVGLKMEAVLLLDIGIYLPCNVA